MNRIDELIAKHCPEGVEYKAIGDFARKTENIRWNEDTDSEFQYIT